MRPKRYPLAQESRAKTRATRAKKISITVDPLVLREVREVVHKEGKNLSAHINDTLARDLRRRRMQQIVDDYEREHGMIEEHELRRVREQWKD